MSRLKRLLFLALVCGALSIGIYFVFWSMVAAAVASAETGREVLDHVRALNAGERAWTDCSQDMSIAITDTRGNEKTRVIVMYVKKYPEDARRSTVFFRDPADVKGMGFLQWSYPHGEDQQWLYLPALKRVRQISGGSKTDSFAGSNLSYEDLAIISQILDWSETDAALSVVGKESIDGKDATVIDMTPTGKKIAYGKVRIWIRSSDSVMVRLEFFSPTLAPLKRVGLGDIKLIGNIPTPQSVEVTDLAGSSHTKITISNIRYDQKLGDEAFSQRVLERGAIQ